MLPGIPPKKVKYAPKLLGDSAISVCLHGAELYVLYSCNRDPALGRSSFLKKVDLNSFNGDMRGVPTIYSRDVAEPGSRTLRLSDKALVINGPMPEIISLDGTASFYSEVDGRLSEEWDSSAWLYSWAGRVYREVDYEEPAKGIDVIDPATRRIVRHLDIDISLADNVHGELLCGQRTNGHFAIYSLGEQRYLHELPLDRYRFRNEGRLLAASTCLDGLAYVLAGDTLLLIDIVSGELLREIKYLQFAALQAHMQAERIRYEHACATSLRICGSGVVLTLSSIYGYVLYLDISRENPYVWFWSEGRKVVALNCPGDLVYGLSNGVPMAWDKYSGEVVWKTSRPTATNRIQVGDQWLVYSQLAGYLQCFQWKKPYISPHRPA